MVGGFFACQGVPVPPARIRDQYVIGLCGAYLAPTTEAVDKHLRTVVAALAKANPLHGARLQADIDLLLEHRHELAP